MEAFKKLLKELIHINKVYKGLHEILDITDSCRKES